MPKPNAADQTVWFIEVQFQRDPEFYSRFFSEIYLYLNQHPQTVDWQAVVIFPKRTIETIMVYKFPQLSREDIERMLGLSELRQTKVYQEALMEGEQSLVLRQLSRRLGTGD